MRYFLIIIALIISFSCISQSNMNQMEQFEKTGWESLDENAIRLIGKDWMLISAGSIESGFNMMTASWGGLGWLWETPVAFIFVRPQRYTFQFTEKEDFFTLTFYDESYRDVLRKMGTVSGRNFDKINESGLTAVATENGSVAFAEARIVVECRKLYSTVLKESEFHDKNVVTSKYPQKDFHTMYVGEIVNVWMKK